MLLDKAFYLQECGEKKPFVLLKCQPGTERLEGPDRAHLYALDWIRKSQPSPVCFMVPVFIRLSF